MTEDIDVHLRSRMEQLVRDQLARYHRVDPTIELSQVVDKVLRDEREKFKRQAEDAEQKGMDGLAQLYRSIIDELPDFAKELKHRLISS